MSLLVNIVTLVSGQFHPEPYCTLSYSANCNGRTNNASAEARYLSV